MTNETGKYSSVTAFENVQLTKPPSEEPGTDVSREPGAKYQPRDLCVILGIPFDNLDLKETGERIVSFVKSGKAHYVATANINFIINALRDPEFMEVVRMADIVTVDGTPILWAAKILGVKLKERVAGSDLVPYLLELSAAHDFRVFFLGGTQESSAGALANIRSRYPNLKAFAYSPPFDPLLEMNIAKIREELDRARPDLLFISFGAGKAEKWMRMYGEKLHIPVCMGVGATIDFLAGKVRRAPLWMQNSGLEWLYRLIQEPGRLWRRYFYDFVYFSWHFASQFINYRLSKIRASSQKRIGLASSTQFKVNNFRPSGRIDSGTVGYFNTQVGELIASGKPIIIDCSEIAFIDSAGLGAFVGLEKHARDSSLPVVLFSVSAEFRRVLEISRTTAFFRIVPDKESAFREIKKTDSLGSFVAKEAIERPGVIHLAARNKIDADTAEKFLEALTLLVPPSSKARLVYLDMTDVTFIDSSGIRVLITLHKRLREEGKEIYITNVSPVVGRIFSIVKIDKYLNVDMKKK